MLVALFGFPRSGKSYFGRRLALELDLPFLDTDHLLEEMAAEQDGLWRPCHTLHQCYGEALFRKREHHVIASLAPRTSGVIAVGGGTFLRPDNLVLLQHSQLIHLQLSPAVLKQRLLQKPVFGLLDPTDLHGSFEQLYQQRRPLYAAIPAYQLTLDGKTDRQILDEMIHGQ